MIELNPQTIDRLLPFAAAWAEAEELRILGHGQPLSASQLADATELGVREAGRVRLLYVDLVPAPTHAELAAAVKQTGLIGANTQGLCLRFGILVRHDRRGDRHLLAHELAHTRQYQRFGSMHAFLQQYLSECLTFGYPRAPLELEAERMARALCRVGIAS